MASNVALSNFAKTQEFHAGIGDVYPGRPTLPSPELLDFREKLIDEEYAEVKEAIAELRQRISIRGSAATQSPAVSAATQSPAVSAATQSPVVEPVETDLTHLASELVDLLYVTYGGLAALGVDADAVFAAIHDANMRKLEGPKREDGKQLKPEGWQPADIKAVIASQLG